MTWSLVTASCALKPTIQKQKPRKVPLLRKADWPKLKSLMRDYQQKFLLNHASKSVEDLWSEFVNTLDTFASQCIRTKLIQGKSSLPWITQSIHRQIRRRDDLYRKLKKKTETKHFATNSYPCVRVLNIPLRHLTTCT